jgi:hypothetical protein
MILESRQGTVRVAWAVISVVVPQKYTVWVPDGRAGTVKVMVTDPLLSAVPVVTGMPNWLSMVTATGSPGWKPEAVPATVAPGEAVAGVSVMPLTFSV